MITARPKILCVDDEPKILKFLETVLLQNDYEAVQASNGEEALDKIKEQSVDLVLSDVRMPRMDGFELCSRIKGDEKLRNIPVVLVTGLTAKEDRIKGIEAGAEDFLTKPIDPAEVLARIRMLLRVKALNERRMGELLIEMNFITEQQLREALLIAKERHIKVGEALCSMGALDKDHCYWALSNQLHMNYVELSPEMLDPELLKQFPIHLLDELSCLPLYETMWEVHFAIADPTDQEIVDKVKGLRRGKIVQLHLALPEKIADLLNAFKQAPPLKAKPQTIVSGDARSLPSSSLLPRRKTVWDDFVSLLLIPSQGDVFWLSRTTDECRLLSQGKDRVKTLQQYPEEAYPLITGHLMDQLFRHHERGQGPVFLREKATRRQEAFRVQHLGCLDRDILKIERIPTFSRGTFFSTYPEAPGLVDDLRALLKEHPRLIMGGQNRLLVKQSCYLSLTAVEEAIAFPPAFFIEDKMEIYFERVAQISRDQFDRMEISEFFKGIYPSLLFYESSSSDRAPDEKFLRKFIPGEKETILVYFPFPSIEAMGEWLSIHKNWEQASFKPFYIDLCHLKSL